MGEYCLILEEGRSKLNRCDMARLDAADRASLLHGLVECTPRKTCMINFEWSIARELMRVINFIVFKSISNYHDIIEFEYLCLLFVYPNN